MARVTPQCNSTRVGKSKWKAKSKVAYDDISRAPSRAAAVLICRVSGYAAGSLTRAHWKKAPPPARTSGPTLGGAGVAFGAPEKIAGPSWHQNGCGSAQCDLAPVSPGKFDAMLPSHRRNTSCLPFGTSAAGPATIRSAFMIEADRTLTAAACPQMTQSGHLLIGRSRWIGPLPTTTGLTQKGGGSYLRGIVSS